MSEFDSYTGILALNQTFQGSAQQLTFDFSAPELRELKTVYQLEALRQPDELATVKQVMAWLAEHVLHGNGQHEDIPKDALHLLALAFDQEQEVLNCAEQSVVLATCLLALGFKAYPLWLLPYNPYDMDNHVIVQVYVEQLDTWLLLDPTCNSYLCDEAKQLLDAFSLRQKLALQEPVQLNQNAHYNGKYYTDDQKETHDLLTYYAKNLFYCRCYPHNSYSGYTDPTIPQLFFLPQGFDWLQREKANLTYRLKKAEQLPEFHWAVPYFKEQLTKLTDRHLLAADPDKLKS